MRKKLCAVVIMTAFCAPEARPQNYSFDCGNVRSTLLALSRRDEGYKSHLSTLFRSGDVCGRDLVKALDDSDFNVNVAAQEVIRYVGDAEGIKALDAWNARNKKYYPVWGPVPVPIGEFDYLMIEVYLVDADAGDLGFQNLGYIYALAADGSPRAKTLLDKVVSRVRSCQQCPVSNSILNRVASAYPFKPFSCENDIPGQVLKNAFFLSDADKKATTPRLLSVNTTRDKALVELYVNHGYLAERWYHVVVGKQEKGWKFLSITFIAMS